MCLNTYPMVQLYAFVAYEYVPKKLVYASYGSLPKVAILLYNFEEPLYTS